MALAELTDEELTEKAGAAVVHRRARSTTGAAFGVARAITTTEDAAEAALERLRVGALVRV